MSLISKALKKVEATRQNNSSAQEDIKNVVYLSEAPQSWPKTALMGLVILSAVGAVMTSVTAITLTTRSLESKQTQVLRLEKRINSLVASINKNQGTIESQIRSLDGRMEGNEAGLKDQIHDAVSSEGGHYSSLKEAALADREEISVLQKRADHLNQKINEITAAMNQAKAEALKASGT